MQIQKEQSPEVWGGIECTINRVQNSFFDQLQFCGHYQRPNDIEQVASTGIKKIRYPVLWETHQPTINSTIDWHWTSQKLKELRDRNIDVIAGLLHHGSGPAYTNLLDDQFPYLLAAYAEKVAKRFPEINFYTPVNEPLTTARFSGLYGIWYPHKTDDTSFLKMLLNQLKGVVLTMQAIRKINPSAQLIQTEDLGKTYSTKSLKYQADFENERRWLTYDLLCGRVDEQHPLWHFLLSRHINRKELRFFSENVCVPNVFGFNYYLTSERFLDHRLNRYPTHTHGGNGKQTYADVEAVRVELAEDWGLSSLLTEAWQRYQKPMAITEVHLHCHREDQLRWAKQVWETCQSLHHKGIHIEAVTFWAMLGSYGWNKLLTKPNGEYEPGVFDVRSGTPRPTALSYFIKKLNDVSSYHSLLKGKGWWLRSSRFFSPPTSLHSSEAQLTECSAPLLIFGDEGILAKEFEHVCKERCIPYKMLSSEDCNPLDADAIKEIIEKFRPWALLNAAGYEEIDKAEAEKETCFALNVCHAQNIALMAAHYNLPFLSFSSNLVFDGKKAVPYSEEDFTDPLNTYGFSKAEAEKKIFAANPNALVIRTGSLFGSLDEGDFAHQIRLRLQNNEACYVASDAVVSFTYLRDLAHTAMDLLIDREKGIWHLSNPGETTFADFANEIADRLQLNRQNIVRLSTADFNYAANRPLNTSLTSNRGMLLPSLYDALRRYTDVSRYEMQKEKGVEEIVRA